MAKQPNNSLDLTPGIKPNVIDLLKLLCLTKKTILRYPAEAYAIVPGNDCVDCLIRQNFCPVAGKNPSICHFFSSPMYKGFLHYSLEKKKKKKVEEGDKKNPLFERVHSFL